MSTERWTLRDWWQLLRDEMDCWSDLRIVIRPYPWAWRCRWTGDERRMWVVTVGPVSIDWCGDDPHLTWRQRWASLVEAKKASDE